MSARASSPAPLLASSRAAVLGLTVLAASAALRCSSWDTGSPAGDEAEKACVDTIEAQARAAERCGRDYLASRDLFLRRDANGDCKNIRAIRDEASLRKTCLPFFASVTCDDLASGKSDPTCARQLQRTSATEP